MKLNAHSVAAQRGFPYIDNEGGKPHDAIPDLWMSRLTMDAARTGPALYVGWMEVPRRWLIELSPQPAAAADLLPRNDGVTVGFSARLHSHASKVNHFYVLESSPGVYYLRCVEIAERCRWGGREEILEDIQKCLNTGCLPGGENGRW